ncbi:MAG: FAD-dependent oxidoreductase [Vulcanimicrobiota bacterium]
MKPGDSLFSNSFVPEYARRPLEHFRGTGKIEAEQPVDTFLPETSNVQGWSHRGLMLWARGNDEGPQDQAKNEEGVFQDQRYTVRYDGDSNRGSLTGVTPQAFEFIEFDGPRIDYLRVTPNGTQVAHHINLERPDQSTIQFFATLEETEPTPGSPACASLASSLAAENGSLKSIYLDGRSLPERRMQLLSELGQQLDSLGAAELKALLERPRADTPLRLVHGLIERSRSDPRARTARELAGEWLALEDLPRASADGLTRTSVNYISPAGLQLATAARGWEFDETSGLPIADSVVIGAGPGGLASAYHLSEAGQHTVILEAGLAGQAFSDGHAMSVHSLRTNSAATDLIYTNDNRQEGIEVSLAQSLGPSRALARQARQEWTEATGQGWQGLSPAHQSEGFLPLNRSEFFDHMARLALGLAEHYPDTFMTEHAPVSSVTRRSDGLFEVATAVGHKLLTRSLVMATGFVGTHGEHARELAQFEQFTQAHQGLWLADNHDEMANTGALLEATRQLEQGKVEHNLVCSDRLLGQPGVRDYVKALPEGSHVGVTGGGESGIKAVLELLHLNPGIGVEYYTSEPLEAYQTQLPSGHLHPGVVEGLLTHPDLAAQSLDKFKAFKTPVTPRSLLSLFEAEQQGRVRVRTLGRHLSPDTVALQEVKTERGRAIGLRVTDPGVLQNLESEARHFQEVGLIGPERTELAPVEMMVTAVGYDGQSMRAGPLLQQLGDQGLVDFQARTTVPGLVFNTAGWVENSADTTLRGRAIRARHIVEQLGEVLPQRDPPQDRIPSGLSWFGLDTNSTDPIWQLEPDTVKEFLDTNVANVRTLEFASERIRIQKNEADRKAAELDQTSSLVFPDFYLQTLYRRAAEYPDSLSPAEKLVLERALLVSQRSHTGPELLKERLK